MLVSYQSFLTFGTLAIWESTPSRHLFSSVSSYHFSATHMLKAAMSEVVSVAPELELVQLCVYGLTNGL